MADRPAAAESRRRRLVAVERRRRVCRNECDDRRGTHGLYFFLRRELGDLARIGGFRFAGRPTQTGKMLGVTFTIGYKGANGGDQFGYLSVEFGTG